LQGNKNVLKLVEKFVRFQHVSFWNLYSTFMFTDAGLIPSDVTVTLMVPAAVPDLMITRHFPFHAFRCGCW
jgi:hypothetical protein